MAVNSYQELLEHFGHEVEVCGYNVLSGKPENVALECMTCNEVLLDYDQPDDDEGDA